MITGGMLKSGSRFTRRPGRRLELRRFVTQPQGGWAPQTEKGGLSPSFEPHCGVIAAPLRLGHIPSPPRALNSINGAPTTATGLPHGRMQTIEGLAANALRLNKVSPTNPKATNPATPSAPIQTPDFILQKSTHRPFCCLFSDWPPRFAHRVCRCRNRSESWPCRRG
jgi:hypothetical protein